MGLPGLARDFVSTRIERVLGIYGLVSRFSRGGGVRSDGRGDPLRKVEASPGARFAAPLARIRAQSRVACGAALLAATAAMPAVAGDDGPGALPESIRAALAATGITPDAVSILVLDAAGQPRLAYRTAETREIGSLMKLVTTLGALERLGPAFRFHTDLYADPVSGGRRGWTLTLRGGGDPAFRYEDLLHLLREAEVRGVRRLAPPVYLDAGRFADEPAATSGIVVAAGRVDATVPWPLAVDFSAVQVLLQAGGPGPLLVDPPFAVVVAPPPDPHPQASCASDWPDAMALAAAPESGAGADPGTLRLAGTWPAACPGALLLRTPLNPAAHFAWTLATAWRALGHRERLRSEPGMAPAHALVELHHDSRPLAELVRDTNKFSNNLMARTLLLDLAAEQGRLPATVAAGAQLLNDWLASRQLSFPELQIENGAGLSHREVLSADHVAALLRYALRSPVAPEFIASLPLPGQDGTLRKRFGGDPDFARLRLKSGSLDGVRNLGGYALDGRGGASVVVCLINSPLAEHAAALQLALLRWVLRGESATKAID